MSLPDPPVPTQVNAITFMYLSHMYRCATYLTLTLPAGMDSSSEPLGGGEDDAACTSASEGLEEGEVEGETLLIVESEDQGSVDLSHDQSGDSLTSDVGEETDGGWACEDMSFYCDRCHKWIPAGEMANHNTRTTGRLSLGMLWVLIISLISK